MVLFMLCIGGMVVVRYRSFVFFQIMCVGEVEIQQKLRNLHNEYSEP